MTCSAANCFRKIIARGLCSKHYQSAKKRGELPPTTTFISNGFCSIDGCGSVHLAKGLCSMHYLRQYKNGTTDIQTMRGSNVMARILDKVIIDEKDCWIFTGTITEKGYGHIRDAKKMRLTHVVTYERKYGPVPINLELDHVICDTKSCCNPDHVAPVTHQENISRYWKDKGLI